MKKILYCILLISVMGCSQNQVANNESSVSVQPEVKIVLDTIAGVGEGAIWDYKYHRLLWIDIPNGKLHIYTPSDGNNKTISVGKEIGTVVPYEQDTVVVALEDGIYTLNLKTEQLQLMCTPESDTATNRLNDGKCDVRGRLWVGSMNRKVESASASLFCVNNIFDIEKKLDSITISNGIAWSLDNKTMYYHDSPTLTVQAYDYNEETSEISNRRVLIKLDSLGSPDGNTIDSEGMLWVANWGAACITRWNPLTGEMLQKINIPALNVTSLAFGGENLDELYVTSAQFYMPENEIENYPDAGKLLVIKTGVKGIKANYFTRN